MTTYNHMYTIAFSAPYGSDDLYDLAFSLYGSTRKDGLDVTEEMLKAALLDRIADIDRSNEWDEAVGRLLGDDDYEHAVSPADLKAALLERIEYLDRHREWHEAVGGPEETDEEEPVPDGP